VKQFFFAVAVVALSAAVSLAEDRPVAPSPTPVGPPIITAGPTTTYVESAQPQRRGLFGRLRNRNSTPTYYSTPAMTAPAPIPSATPMPPVTPPQPMPGVRPAGGAIIPATSTSLPPGIYTTTDGTIIQVGGTMPGTMPMMNMSTGMMTSDMTSSTSSSGRRGLFGRLRNR
jgi:hypothetical protein